MKLVTRQGWNAAPPKRSPTPLRPSVIDTLFFHYSAADADEQADHAKCAGRVKGIQAFHQGPARGWNDIAYSFLICKHGTVFEGRGWDVRTAATGDDNNHSLAICFLGDDSKGRDDVTADGREALVGIARAAQARYGNLEFKGHRDVMSTACPGDEIYGFVTSRGFRKLVEDDVDQAPELEYWTWLAWTLGEGEFKGMGKRNQAVRPTSVRKRIPAGWWARRTAYLLARKTG